MTHLIQFIFFAPQERSNFGHRGFQFYPESRFNFSIKSGNNVVLWLSLDLMMAVTLLRATVRLILKNNFISLKITEVTHFNDIHKRRDSLNKFAL